MKRLILISILFALTPALVQAAKYNPFDTSKEVKGPVKSKALSFYAGSNVSFYYRGSRGGSVRQAQITYYDSLGRETKMEQYYRKKLDYVTITTYDSTTSVSRTYDAKNKPNEYYEEKHYNHLGLPICEIQYHKDTVKSRDSLVYNQWNKPAIVYYARGKEPYRLSEAYKYDSIGNLIGMRSFDKEGKMSGGFEVQYTDTVVRVHYFGRTYYSHYRDKSDDGPDSWTAEYFYDEQHRLIREEGLKFKLIFSNFDEYGNPTKCEQHNYYGLNDYSNTTIREFTYW